MSDSKSTFAQLLSLLIEVVALRVGEDAWNDGGCQQIDYTYLCGHLQFKITRVVDCIDCYYKRPTTTPWQWSDCDFFTITNLSTGEQHYGRNRDQLMAALRNVDRNMELARERGTMQQEYPEYVAAEEKWLEECKREKERERAELAKYA